MVWGRFRDQKGGNAIDRAVRVPGHAGEIAQRGHLPARNVVWSALMAKKACDVTRPRPASAGVQGFISCLRGRNPRAVMVPRPVEELGDHMATLLKPYPIGLRDPPGVWIACWIGA